MYNFYPWHDIKLYSKYILKLQFLSVINNFISRINNFHIFQLSRVKYLGSTSRIGATRKEYLKNSLRGEFEKSTEIESNSTAVQQPASRLNSNSQSWNSGIDVSNIRNSLLSTTNLSAVERNDTWYLILHLTTRSWNGKSMGRKTIFFTPFWNIFFPPPFISIFLFFFFCFLFFFFPLLNRYNVTIHDEYCWQWWIFLWCVTVALRLTIGSWSENGKEGSWFFSFRYFRTGRKCICFQ